MTRVPEFTAKPSELAASLRALADQLDVLGDVALPGFDLRADVILHPTFDTTRADFSRVADTLGLRTRVERSQDGKTAWRDRTVLPALTVTVYRTALRGGR